MIGIWVLRTLSVWMVTEAWWQCVCSVLSVEMNQMWITVLLFLFSAVLNGMLLSSRRKYLVPAASLGIVAAVIWGIVKKGEVFAGTLNHFANAYMRMGASSEQTFLLYRESGAAIMQRTMVTALMFLPLIFIFSFILFRQKGRVFAVILMVFPIFLPVLKTGFPGMWECWNMILAAGIYVSILDVKESRDAWKRVIASTAVLLVLMFLSAGIGEKIETKRKQEGNAYYKIRTSVQTNVIEPIEHWLKSEEEVEEAKKENKKKEPEPEEDPAEDQEGEEPVTMPWDGNGVTAGSGNRGMKNLANIAAFAPDNRVDLEVTVPEKPDRTVYYPLWYGFTYYASVWDKIPVDQTVDDEFYAVYSQELERLIALCQEHPCDTPKDVTEFINKEFEEHTKYDYMPGSTPPDQDFAEYFLFENKKGFCVHFATTATLIYRIYGIKARYAEGYAVPAHVFERQGDGSYKARVTGEMGHAWCEIYDGEWQIREHTLSYEGPEPGPATDTKKSTLESKEVRLLFAAAAVSAVILVLVLAFFLQAGVRRKKRKFSYYKTSREAGIRNMYQNIYDTAVFLGMQKGDPLSSDTLKRMNGFCKGISKEELEWLKTIVQEILFYERIPTKEELERTSRIHGTLIKNMRHELNGFKKLKYRYISCLG